MSGTGRDGGLSHEVAAANQASNLAELICTA
ncbi:hypothetical protein EPYR_02266 [Erwinia pyrifoliae DSM 12163]|nr:hypothetical protein EPYR_02266 [Erwinia pyrifoliae DSM 12163]